MLFDLLYNIIIIVDLSTYFMEYLGSHSYDSSSFSTSQPSIMKIEEVVSQPSSIKDDCNHQKTSFNLWGSFKTIFIDIYNYFTQSNNVTVPKTTPKDIVDTCSTMPLKEQINKLTQTNLKLVEDIAKEQMAHASSKETIKKLSEEVTELTLQIDEVTETLDKLYEYTGLNDPNELVDYIDVGIRLIGEQGSCLNTLYEITGTETPNELVKRAQYALELMNSSNKKA